MRQSPSRQTKMKSSVRRYDAAVIDLGKLFRKFAMCVATPYSSSAARAGQPYANPALSASSYESPDNFKHDYQVYNLLRKCKPDSAADSAAQKAIDKFVLVDGNLAKLRDTLTWSSLALNEPVVHAILHRAARKIERLIGESLSFGDLLEHCGFSHGASAKTPRVRGESCFKYSCEYPEVTPQLAGLAKLIIKLTPPWSRVFRGFQLCSGNRITTVPKDRDIDRPIACEPMMNMYIQKGIGGFIREALKRRGIDLDDQTVNQELARLGSITDELATVDLASASDSVSLSICSLLLPREWYDLLLLTRSDCGLLPDGSFITYEKVSSMGNGFTFELESLIFWAITQSCEDYMSDQRKWERHKCSVYGDDIVCRSRTVPLLTMVLSTCGFNLNVDKTFSIGPFRESCGKHFFRGVDVTPIFIRNETFDIQDQLLYANNLRRWNRRLFGVDDPRYVSVYKWFVKQLPAEWQTPRIPDGYGDGALFGTLDEVLPSFNKAGKYHAKVLSRVRRTLDLKKLKSADDELYYSLNAVYNGQGGLCAWFAGASGSEKPYDEEYVGDWHKTNTQAETLRTHAIKFHASSKRDPDVLPIPGVYKLTRKTVRLMEWLDA